MDFELDYEREREFNGMILEFEGMEINIPEELVEEIISLMKIEEYELQKVILEDAKIFKECLVHNKEFDLKTFEDKFLKYLNNELDIFRPNNIYTFDPMGGFYFDNNKINITIDGFDFCFSKELIQERKNILRFDTLDEVIFDIENLISGYLNCLSKKELENPYLNKQVEDWLISELNIFRS